MATVFFQILPQASDIYYMLKNKRQIGDFTIIDNDFQRRLSLMELKKNELISRYKSSDSKKTHYDLITSPTTQFIFETLDGYAGVFGIELRHPIMDKRLIEFCYSLPTEIKFNHGWDRMLVRIGLADLLPKEIQWRERKFSCSPVFEKNLLLFEKRNLNYLIKEKNLKKYVNYKEISKIYDQYINGSFCEADFDDLWRILILSKWLNFNNYSD